MSLIAPLLPLLGESITWKSVSSIDQYGDPTTADSTITVIWFDTATYRDGQKFSDAYFQSDSAIKEGDKVTRNGITWLVSKVESTPALGGESLKVFYLRAGPDNA